MDIKEQVKNAVNKIIGKISAKKIILFGSIASGENTNASDIDLCFITDIKDQRKLEIIREIRRNLIQFLSYPLDILVYDEKEFNERSTLKNTFEYKILRDGVIVYGQ